MVKFTQIIEVTKKNEIPFKKYFFDLSFNLGVICLLASCSGKPVVMTEKDVKVSRNSPSSDCKELGMVMGRSLTINSNVEKAVEQSIEEMKRDAANKGANYVKIEQIASNTHDVTGIAYDCK